MELIIEKKRTAMAPTLMIAGCCIGAGMIGLPVVSAQAGFLPSALAMVLCYFFATSTGLLLLEATLSFDRPVNLITMAQSALGRVGKGAALGLFLFLFYCLFVAYIEGGGHLFAQLFGYLLGIPIERQFGIVACVAFVGLTTYAGTHAVVKLNRVFMCGIAASYLLLITLGLSHFNGSQLSHVNLAALTTVLPVLLVCFGYQNLVPLLTEYTGRDVSVMKKAIYLGNLIPFVIYLAWNYVILGMLPANERLSSNGGENQMVTDLLQETTGGESVLMAVGIFTLLSILMPFIANTLAFVDFLKDGFVALAKRKYEGLTYLLVLLPPTLLSLSYPQLFLKALGLVGGLADVLLFGLLPVLIVGVRRYVQKVETPYRVSGGKGFLFAVLAVSTLFLIIRG